MRIYRVYLTRIMSKIGCFPEVRKKYCIPIRGESEEDVREYLEKEFIPEMKKGFTSLCIGNLNAEIIIDKIAMPLERG